MCLCEIIIARLDKNLDKVAYSHKSMRTKSFIFE